MAGSTDPSDRRRRWYPCGLAPSTTKPRFQSRSKEDCTSTSVPGSSEYDMNYPQMLFGLNIDSAPVWGEVVRDARGNPNNALTSKTRGR